MSDCAGLPFLVLAVLTAAFFVVRQFVRGPKYHSSKRLDGKTVVISGGNSGIGYETAKDLCRRGARVVMLCRDTNKARKAVSLIREALEAEKADAGPGEILYRKLDLASLASVRRCADEVLSEEQRIDILILNAGVMVPPTGARTEDDFEMQIGTNHLGHFLLARLLMPLVKKTAKESQAARIVVVSSLAHVNSGGPIMLDNFAYKDCKPFRAYSQSKLANILFARELGKKLKGTGVNTYVLHPGVIASDLGRHSMSHDQLLIRIVFPIFYHLLSSVIKDPWYGAQTTLFCCLDDSIKNETGRYYSDCKLGKPSKHALNDADAAKLWDISEQITGCKDAEI